MLLVFDFTGYHKSLHNFPIKTSRLIPSLVFQSYLLRFGAWMVCCWGPVIPSHVWVFGSLGPQTKRVQSCMIFLHGGFGSLLPKQNPSENAILTSAICWIPAHRASLMQSLLASMKGFGVGIPEHKNVTSFWW